MEGLSLLQRWSESTRPNRLPVTPENTALLQQHQAQAAKTAVQEREQRDMNQVIQSAKKQGMKNWVADQMKQKQITRHLREEDAMDDNDDEDHPHRRHSYPTIDAEYFNEGLSFFQEGSEQELSEEKQNRFAVVTRSSLATLRANQAAADEAAAEAKDEQRQKQDQEDALRQGKMNWMRDKMTEQHSQQRLLEEDVKARRAELAGDDDDKPFHRSHGWATIEDAYFNGGDDSLA